MGNDSVGVDDGDVDIVVIIIVLGCVLYTGFLFCIERLCDAS